MKIVLTDAKTVFDELVTPAPLRELGEVDEYGTPTLLSSIKRFSTLTRSGSQKS